ncbi:MAG: pyridoxal phosphate-dependent aminotransferase family protein [Verrucomicrobiae bacterium]|nr:pyridoxal phosphate-dependent aminotransferase family protein [Verrucomicrobiae bacterium]
MSEPQPLQLVDRTHVRCGRRPWLFFGGCDYLGLAWHPVVRRALSEGVQRGVLNVAASRLTTGNDPLYGRLECELAAFFGVESALLVSTGYATNLVVAQALSGRFTHALLDVRAHVSLADAALWLGCPVLKFRHRDVKDFERVLRRCGRRARPLVLTDGLFAHDGGVAPLRAYQELLPPGGWLLVDDAHGAGVVGERGRGTVAASGIRREHVIQCVTLSKAFGSFGGAVLGPASVRRAILERSHMFAGSTPLPLPWVRAALAALNLLRNDAGLHRRLRSNAAWLKGALRESGFVLPDAPGPIVSLMFRDRRRTLALERALMRNGIHPSLIRYPGAPAGGYFRFVVSSAHTRAQLQRLARTLAPFAKCARAG